METLKILSPNIKKEKMRQNKSAATGKTPLHSKRERKKKTDGVARRQKLILIQLVSNRESNVLDFFFTARNHITIGTWFFSLNSTNIQKRKREKTFPGSAVVVAPNPFLFSFIYCVQIRFYQRVPSSVGWMSLIRFESQSWKTIKVERKKKREEKKRYY